MKKCKNCMSEIDDHAKKCPHCLGDQRNWFVKHPVITALLILFILGSLVTASGGNSNKRGGSATPGGEKEVKQEEKKVEPIIEAAKVDALSFVQEFDKNQLAAEQKYKDKYLEISAFISNISEDILGIPYLSLEPTSEKYYFGTSMQCSFSEKSELTSLQNGQEVTVRGKFTSQTLGIIGLKDCKVVK